MLSNMRAYCSMFKKMTHIEHLMKLIFWSLTFQMPNIIAFSTFSTPDESALRREVSSISLLSFYAIDLSRHGKTGQTCLIHNLIDLTRTRPDPPVLPRLPTSSRLRLKYNFYKIFTYSSLLNMLYISL